MFAYICSRAEDEIFPKLCTHQSALSWLQRAIPASFGEMTAYFNEFDLVFYPKPPELDVAETGSTFVENASLKASEVAKFAKSWAIADDSGLSVDALDGAPGLYSARYGKTDADRIDRLLRELGKSVNRKARFVCAIAVARPDGAIAFSVCGECPGEILTAPRGRGGFGYDPVFYLPDRSLTFAEMTPEEKRERSHRGIAFRLLIPQLRPVLAAKN